MKKLSIILIALLFGCIEIVECPGYNPIGLIWMPYEVKDRIVFTDSVNNFEFIVDEAYYTNEFKFIGFEEGEDCDAEASFNTYLNTNCHLEISCYSSIENQVFEYEYSINVYDNSNSYIFNSFVFNFATLPELSNAILLTNYTINDKIYGEALEVCNDQNGLNNESDVYGIVLAPDVGIIEIRTIGKTYCLKN